MWVWRAAYQRHRLTKVAIHFLVQAHRRLGYVPLVYCSSNSLSFCNNLIKLRSKPSVQSPCVQNKYCLICSSGEYVLTLSLPNASAQLKLFKQNLNGSMAHAFRSIWSSLGAVALISGIMSNRLPLSAIYERLSVRCFRA